MQVTTNKNFFKGMLTGHSSVGLMVGALMYVICLTGTIAVFFPEFERWQQADVPEFQHYTANTITTAIEQYQLKTAKSPESLYVVLPTDSVPRMHVSDGELEWWLQADGKLSSVVNEGWTHMLTELHANLHLPKTFGLLIVSIFGVMLVHLCISGVLSHSRIFKDAFRLRLTKERQQQIDLHNRLSVWALPFHFMIAITGAFFGLVSLLVLFAAPIFYDNDRQAMVEDVYGSDPNVVSAQVKPVNIAVALNNLALQAPKATAIYIVIQKISTENQFIEIAATLPGRLIYSEMYRFDANGNYINHQGLSDGITGRQLLYSVYRIHFGHFGGLLVKIAFVLLGLSLTVISVTGINIWLKKREQQDWINHAWCGIVWGLLIALVASACCSILLNISAIVVLVIIQAATIAACLYWQNINKGTLYLQRICACLLLALVIGHISIFYSDIYNAFYLWVNVTLIAIAIVMFNLRNDSHNSSAGICLNPRL